MEHGGPDFDYSVFVAALGIMSVALVLTFYHCIVVTWCNHRNGDRPVGLHAEDLPMRSVEISTARSIPPAHAYRKGEGTVGGGEEESVCAVCLCEFKDEEQVRELPECKHLFHVPCIDMWLYSHSSCPMCRSETPRQPQQYPETQRPSDGLLEFGG